MEENLNISMMYCPPNVTFTDIWVKHGVSHCFLDTVTSATYGLFILIFGVAQWLMYRRFATPVQTFIRPKSHLLTVQLILQAFVPFLTTVQLILLDTVIGDKTIYGYELVYFFVNLIAWPLAIRLVLLERHYQLPTVPSNGHGIVLLVFWTLVFVAENLIFINLKNEEWWFNLSNLSDKLEFSIFVFRYVVCCLILVIGFKAPGVAMQANPLTEPLTSSSDEQLISAPSVSEELHGDL